MFLDRDRTAGKYLEWKVRTFSVAAVVALVAMALESRWLTAVAIGVLVVGLLLRFLPGEPEELEAAEDD